MATMTPILPDELMSKLTRLGNQTDEICEHALKAGAEVAETAVETSLKAVIGKGTKYPSRSTGELCESLGTTPVKQGKDGNLNIKIGFNEPRSYGGSNAKIANILEYGTQGQRPTGFLKKAKSKCKKATADAMKAVLEEEMNKV